MFEIDALYVTRPQVERWSVELLERYADSLSSAREELEKRRKSDSNVDIWNTNQEAKRTRK